MNKESGLLLHPTSLPSPYGIGDLGKGAYRLIDFLEAGGQSLWQILPLGPAGTGNSPYQSLSSFAGYPLLIDLEALSTRGLLKKKELDPPPFKRDQVEYHRVKEYKLSRLRRGFRSFKRDGGSKKAAYRHFYEHNKWWLDDYGLFMALHESYKGLAWPEWPLEYAADKSSQLAAVKEKEAREIEFHIFLQYLFFSQWEKLREYAAARGIKIIGDLPVFVAHDSCDVWLNQQLFQLDERGYPKVLAGVPPDYFNDRGQLWGNPHYRWEEMKKRDYKWWRERLSFWFKGVHLLRIDHFRGFEACWEIPAGAEDALAGRWVKGPGADFFSTIEKYLGKLPVIAEDLGHITPEVIELRKKFGYPGMRVLQFVLEEKKKELEEVLNKEEIVLYTGTHDNNTLLGWYSQKNSEEQKRIGESLSLDCNLRPESICWQVIELALGSRAKRVVIPLQDLLALGSEARMNMPGVAEGNWEWRVKDELLREELALRLKELTRKYGR